ncbi:unnamed protein product [Ambrosiozyma monospora]|uniref:Unnamed protein product n=1 Tax=Ambrosiozyma monospora TaxID=43982 RepID=A0A9W6YSW3_AMBMO|nr:unnamed protein product [Ambrosiozyma monospora]
MNHDTISEGATTATVKDHTPTTRNNEVKNNEIDIEANEKYHQFEEQLKVQQRGLTEVQLTSRFASQVIVYKTKETAEALAKIKLLNLNLSRH